MSPALSVKTDALTPVRAISPHAMNTPQSAIIDVPPGWNSPSSGSGGGSEGSSSRPDRSAHPQSSSDLQQQQSLSKNEGVIHRPSVDLEPPLPLSASSSSASSVHFPWPTAPSSYSNIVRDRSDPFDSTLTFADDPFARSSSSSSGGDDDHRRRSSQFSEILPSQSTYATAQSCNSDLSSDAISPHSTTSGIAHRGLGGVDAGVSVTSNHSYHPGHVRAITDPNIHEGIPIDTELATTSAVKHSHAAGFPFGSDAVAGLGNDGGDENGFYPSPGGGDSSGGTCSGKGTGTGFIHQHPTLNRTFSSPLPNRVGSLRHPLSPTLDRLRSYAAHPPSPQHVSPTISMVLDQHQPQPRQQRSITSSASSDSTLGPNTPLQALSLELADSLQTAIQTLLHLSPPHLLDNAKEQYSGCTVQMPTTSLSALLTSMRGLNYLSANVVALCEGLSVKHDMGILAGGHRTTEDFDIGELLQNVADLLSGQAAQASVDLVLFHGDVGIKHTSVTGDKEGIAYVLSHVIRQILLVASPGDTIELGLQILPQSPSMTPRIPASISASDAEAHRSHRAPESPGHTMADRHGSNGEPLLCIFEIVHNIAQLPDSNSATPRAELNPFTRLVEEKEAATPKLDSLLCRRLLQHVNASLKTNTQPSSPMGVGLPRHAYEVAVLLPRGHPIEEPMPLSSEEQAIRQPFSTLTLAREPTLRELADFADSLRGKKVNLHASLSSVFARHLTSYLAAWGLDVSHIPIEEEDEFTDRQSSVSHPDMNSNMAGLSIAPSSTDKFIVIDDDVSILRRELLRLRAESPFNKNRLHRRPSISTRTRSTPHIRPPPAARNTPMLIHFTSLAKYNQVRDVVTNLLGAGWATTNGALAHPEVMVIPKPVGPRRFLTALHTAVNQPIVDPFFSPIATSPRSPGGPGYIGGRTPTERETGFFDSVAEEHESESGAAGQSNRPSPQIKDSNTKARSPLGEFPPSSASIIRTNAGLHLSIPTPGEIVATPASEYFSSVKPNTSGASGVVMQSPDGRPFGMFFEPPPRGNGENRKASAGRIPSDSLRMNTISNAVNNHRRRSSAGMDDIATSGHPVSTTTSPQSSRRTSAISTATATTTTDGSTSRRSSGIDSQIPEHANEQHSRRQSVQSPSQQGPSQTTSGRPRAQTLRSARRRTMPGPVVGSTEPVMAQGRDRASTLSKSIKNTPMSSPNLNVGTSPSGSFDTFDTVPFHPPRQGKKAILASLEEDITRLVGSASGMSAKAPDVVVPPINVLIVEDNPINQNILSKFFLKKKIQHQTANNGLEAVEKWKTGGFHLILMDLQLPVMNGIEATKEIRKMEKNNNIGVFPSTPVSEQPRPFSPFTSASGGSGNGGSGVGSQVAPSSPFRSAVIIVALTASSAQSDRVSALAAGCNDFLTKPVSLKWLEKKTIEWGCMQALIDFDGWRRWKGADQKDDTKRAFQLAPQAQARAVASKLRIDRTKSRSILSNDSSESGPDIHIQSATPEPSMSLDSTTSITSDPSSGNGASARNYLTSGTGGAPLTLVDSPSVEQELDVVAPLPQRQQRQQRVQQQQQSVLPSPALAGISQESLIGTGSGSGSRSGGSASGTSSGTTISKGSTGSEESSSASLTTTERYETDDTFPEGTGEE